MAGRHRNRTPQAAKDKLYQSFLSYVEFAISTLGQQRALGGTKSQKLEIVYYAPSDLLRSKVETVERSPKFGKLAHDYLSFVRTEFSDKYPAHTDEGSDSDALNVFDIFPSHICEFFRNSGFYLKAFKNQSVSPEQYFDLICSAARRRKVKITRLWMCLAEFPENSINVGCFQIRKYNKRELDKLVHNEINRVFYHEAVINADLLSKYWFVREELTVERVGGPRGDIVREERTGGPKSWLDEELESPLFEAPVERDFPPRVIQLLSLADWDSGDGANREFFSIPLSMGIDDDILAEPEPTPPFAKLTTAPKEWAWGNNSAVWSVKMRQVNELKRRVEMATRLMNKVNLEEHNWQFIDIALGYLAKAFMARDELEQLLWYVVVLESLFGEKERVLETIKRRLVRIFGKTAKDKATIRKKIGEVYDFRSSLVHGTRYASKAQAVHLADARFIARRSLLWFFEHLWSIFTSYDGKEIPRSQFPRRDELLAVLDFDNPSLNRLRVLIDNLPQAFHENLTEPDPKGP